jgi:hypothetical protein
MALIPAMTSALKRSSSAGVQGLAGNCRIICHSPSAPSSTNQRISAAHSTWPAENLDPRSHAAYWKQPIGRAIQPFIGTAGLIEMPDKLARDPINFCSLYLIQFSTAKVENCRAIHHCDVDALTVEYVAAVQDGLLVQGPRHKCCAY